MAHLVGQSRRGFFRVVAGHEVDARPVERRADGLGKKRPVVAGVIPGQATGITAFVPELFEVLAGAQRLW